MSTGNKLRCDPQIENLVHTFLDGELPVEHQPRVFAHLAECRACRRIVNSMLQFRQVMRQEYLPVPAAVDEAFFRKLEQHKALNQRRDRVEDRQPLWQARRLVSLRLAVFTGIVLLGLGLLFPRAEKQTANASFIHAETEHVEFRDVIYVIYPGLTVEALKLEL